jgi:uncharacterized protein YbbC (DUF1343 family)
MAAVGESRSPGAVGYVGDLDRVYLHKAVGLRQLEPEPLPATIDTIYDLASLTKVVATTTATLLLQEEGAIDLDKSVFHYLPIPAFDRFTVRHCLTHTAGLVPTLPIYREVQGIDSMLQRYAAEPLLWAPGSRWTYSDPGFMILGRIIELVAGDSLDAFCRKRIFAPLSMSDTAFNPPEELRARCAATERCPWRNRIMMGQVHDENAYAVGGVAGHAGLFGTAEDLAKFCSGLLRGVLLKETTVEAMLRFGQTIVWPWQGLGWQLDPWVSKNLGFLASRTAFGHSGWTGTSVWIDGATGRFAILLSNTCHPSRASRDNGGLRNRFYIGVSRRFYADIANVHTGLDRLVREEFEVLRGKRIALLTHPAAVDQQGRHVRHVLLSEPEIALVRLYGPEHGVHGRAEAGAAVQSEGGVVPVTSLYGAQPAPTRDELAEIDLFVVDLQDVGARYYTYPATLKACLRACADAGKPVVVLDRPNPTGGVVLEGPIAEFDDSMVCWGRVPARHGMTIGEIAQWFAAHALRDAAPQVTVLALDNWRPELLFDMCCLAWEPPSPNIPDATTALLYTGMCLFEGTNLNEGRGTDAPFQVIGAPWLKAAKIIERMHPENAAGVVLESVEYNPRAIPGKASAPRFQNERCEGVRVRVTDARRIRPFTLALALLIEIRRQHRQFEWTGAFDRLAGNSDLRQQIDDGESAGRIVAGYAAAHFAYDSARPKTYIESV